MVCRAVGVHVPPAMASHGLAEDDRGRHGDCPPSSRDAVHAQSNTSRSIHNYHQHPSTSSIRFCNYGRAATQLFSYNKDCESTRCPHVRVPADASSTDHTHSTVPPSKCVAPTECLHGDEFSASVRANSRPTLMAAIPANAVRLTAARCSHTARGRTAGAAVRRSGFREAEAVRLSIALHEAHEAVPLILRHAVKGRVPLAR